MAVTGAVPMIRLATQFDPPGAHAAEAAIPGGCCSCCCCCCCLATTVSISAVAAIQASRKAREATVRPARADLWIVLAGTALLAAATLSGAVAWAISSIAPGSMSTSAVVVFGLLAVWCTLLGSAFRGVGFKEPLVRAVVFAVIGVIAFLLEAIIGFFLVVSVWPLYLLGAAAVIAFVIWRASRPRVPPSDVAGSSPQ